MKKIVIGFLIVTLFSPFLALAYDEARDDGFRDPTTRRAKVYAQRKLEKARLKRFENYISKKLRSRHEKNVLYQKYKHISNLIDSHVSRSVTKLDRDGDLRTIPYYKNIRPYQAVDLVPNNAKRNFRVRAYDYYVDGGNAGAKPLLENAINYANHRIYVNRIPRSSQLGYYDALSNIRKQQKDLTKKSVQNKVPTGYQKNTYRRGASSRNLIHPFLGINFDQFQR